MTELTTVQEINNTFSNAPLDNKLIQKLREKFTEQEQQLFVQNFCMYLNYDKENDYVIDLDQVWQWMGFSTKQKAKELLVKHFSANEDYKIVPLFSEKNPQEVFNQTVENSQGGRPAEKIMLNIKTFKRMCMKANTKKASEIHDYYITMEETLQEYINETYLEREQRVRHEQKLIKEQTLVESFHGKSVNYFGSIGEVDGALLGKFGWTDDIWTRIDRLKKELGERFTLDCVIECEKNAYLEKQFKQYVSDRRVTKIINGKKQTELIKLDNSFGPDEVMKVYRLLKQTIEASINSEKELLTLQIELLRAQNALKQTELETKRLEYSRSAAKRKRILEAYGSASTSSLNETPQRAPQRSNRQVVSQYTLDGRLVQQHSSFAAAAKAVDGNRNTLADKCRAQTVYKDYIWKCE